MSATLNALESDIEEDPPAGSQITTHIKKDNFEIPLAMYIQVKPGPETLEKVKRLRNDQHIKQIIRAGKKFCAGLINVNQMTTISKATACGELPFRGWHTEMPTNQEEAGETPYTLHERRPPSNNDTPQSSQKDYIQQIEKQRESLNRRT